MGTRGATQKTGQKESFGRGPWFDQAMNGSNYIGTNFFRDPKRFSRKINKPLQRAPVGIAAAKTFFRHLTQSIWELLATSREPPRTTEWQIPGWSLLVLCLNNEQLAQKKKQTKHLKKECRKSKTFQSERKVSISKASPFPSSPSPPALFPFVSRKLQSLPQKYPLHQVSSQWSFPWGLDQKNTVCTINWCLYSIITLTCNIINIDLFMRFQLVIYYMIYIFI